MRAGDRAVVGVEAERRPPQQPVAEPREALDGVGHRRGVAALEAVGEHDRQRAAGAVGVARRVQELLQRGADAGAAVGVLDDLGDVGERGVDVALAQLLGDPRQARAERERLGLRGPGEAQVVGDLRAQRAGDVDQDQQRARAVRAVAARERG